MQMLLVYCERNVGTFVFTKEGRKGGAPFVSCVILRQRARCSVSLSEKRCFPLVVEAR